MRASERGKLGPMPRCCRLPALLALAAALFGSCAYQPGASFNPVRQSLTWFSFIGGDDLRAGCAPGSPDRFRLVYNGRWDEQVRTYELGLAGPRQLEARVFGPADLSEMSLGSPYGPWRGIVTSVTLGQPDYDSLLGAIQASDAYSSPEQTLTLPSDRFFWIAASCHRGVFHLTGWLHPSPEFAAATFPAQLVALDTTGAPLNPPRPWTIPHRISPGITFPRGSSPTPWAVGITRDRLVQGLGF